MASALVATRMTENRHVAVHLNPIWRDRADHVIRARIPESEGHHIQLEQLWAKRIEDHVFDIRCIPFHLYDLALGDRVHTNAALELVGVIRRSGHVTYRVWFGDQPASRAEVENAVLGLGGSVEWSGSDLMAIDAPDKAISQAIADYLFAQQQIARLVYETGDKTPR